MDNQNTNTPNTIYNTPPQPVFPPAQTPPPQNPSPLSKTLNWLKSHKKLTIIALIGFIGFIGLLVLLGYSKNNPNPAPSTPPTSEISLPSSIQIKTSKAIFSLSEKITVSAVASSNKEAISAFDTAIEYDPEALTLSSKKPPSIPEFDYFSSDFNGLFRASAVAKPEASAKVFDNTTLFEIEFTPKKPGKTILKVLYTPNSTNDSNLLNSESKDILGNVRGVEITIE